MENSGAGNKTYAPQEGTIGNGICLDSQGLVARQVQVSFQPDESKFLFNLTKRQVVCFGLGALIGVPAFFLAKDALGVSPSVLLMMLLMLPFFLLAMFERHGQPLEVLIRHFIQARFVRPRIRVWQNDNFYKTIDRSIRNQQEVQKILRGKQRKNQADKG